MLGPAKADTPRELLGNVGVSVEEAKAKGGSTVMGRRVESSRVSTTAMRARVSTEQGGYNFGY